MESKTKKTIVKIKEKPSALNENYILRQKAESELRSINRRLNKATEWIPLLKELDPSVEPTKILTSLRKRQIELIHKVGSMRKEQMGEPGRNGMGELNDLMADPKKLAEYRLKMATLKKLQKAADFNASDVQFSPSEDSPEPWTALISRFQIYHLPDIRWGNHDSAFSFSVWDFSWEPQRGILGHFGYFSIDPPEWSDLNGEPRRGQYVNLGAFAFDVPPSSFDAIVNFEAEVKYALQLQIHAAEALFIGSPKLCIQPDINIGGHTGLADFDYVGNGYWIDESDVRVHEILSSTIYGNFRVNAGKTSRIYIGMEWYLDVENGMGSTIDGWDSFIFFPPNGEDLWGVRVNVVPI